MEQAQEHEKSNTATIIGAIVGAVVTSLVIYIGIVVWMKWRSAESTEVSMVGETINQIRTQNNATVMKNPLWTLRIDDDTDDPFVDDFEEDCQLSTNVLGGGY